MSKKCILVDNLYYPMWYLGKQVTAQVYVFHMAPVVPPIHIWDAYQITDMRVLSEGVFAMDFMEMGEDYEWFVK